MAYEKTEWKAREGEGLNRFKKFQEDETTVFLENIPSVVTVEGTPFSSDNMNKIEEGIYQAHVENQNQAASIQNLTASDQNINNRIDQEIQNRQTAISYEQTAREQQIDTAITSEAQDRQLQIDELRGELQETNHVLEGVHTTSLLGATLTRILGGTTEIPKNLFDIDTVFMAGKTLIFDKHGTTGVYIQDIDTATILVFTKSISPVAALEPKLLGSVRLYGDLPLTVTAAEQLWGRTPRIDEFAQVITDENFGGLRVEYYITDIDDQGNITWGNPIPLNTADFQAQTTAADSGKVLVGGANPGTFGESLSVDTAPTLNSNNIMSSGGVFAWFGAAVSTLKTTAKNTVGAINELVNSIATKITANSAITGATKTKITYDSKGLVTAGADATVADIAAAAVNPGTTETSTKITTSISYSLSNWIIQIFNRINWLITTATDLNNKLTIKANLDSPDFKGTPTAPTAAATVINKQIATMEAVHAVADNKMPAPVYAHHICLKYSNPASSFEVYFSFFSSSGGSITTFAQLLLRVTVAFSADSVVLKASGYFSATGITNNVVFKITVTSSSVNVNTVNGGANGYDLSSGLTVTDAVQRIV